MSAPAAPNAADHPPARRPRALIVMRNGSFADLWGPGEIDRLHTLAEVAEPVQLSSLDQPEARQRLEQIEVLISSWGCPRLDAGLLAHAPRLTTVLHAAGSVQSLVSEAMWERGIQITSCAELNAVPVAEFALAAILMAGKKGPFIASSARTGRSDWASYRYTHGPLSNLDQTIGIIGYSKIGRRVVERLCDLEVTVLVTDPVVEPAIIRAAGAEPVSLAELLQRSDTVSVHAPSLPSTYRMLGAAELALMKDKSTLINTARGALIDTAALEAECSSGRLNAMLDVTDPEPLPDTSVLYDLPNVMLTPHIAGSIGNETRRMSRHVLDELQRYGRGEPLTSLVSREELATLA